MYFRSTKTISGTEAVLSEYEGIVSVEVTAKASSNLTLHVEKLIETQNINTTNITESAGKIKDLIAATLMDAVRDVEVAY